MKQPQTPAPEPDDEPVPDFWASLTIPDDAPPPPQLDEPVPFMVGNGKRWQREAVRGLGHPSRAGEPHGLAPAIERFVRATSPKGDAA